MRRLHLASRGTTLVELLIGTLVGLIVLGIALQLTLYARARYQRIADEALIEDRGTQALELLTTAVQQAGWVTDTPASWAGRRWTDTTAPRLSLHGNDNCRASKIADSGIDCADRGAVAHSDALLVRFGGKSTQPDGLQGDGSVYDCSGYDVPERIKDGPDDPFPGIMLLYITESTDADKEPQLMCVSRGHNKGELTSALGRREGMVRGVETMQILYTVGTPGETSPQILSARDITNDQWRNVQAVHIALVVHGNYDDPHAAGKRAPTLALFPNLPATIASAQDRQFTPTLPLRRRARFTATVHVRNPLTCAVDVC